MAARVQRRWEGFREDDQSRDSEQKLMNGLIIRFNNREESKGLLNEREGNLRMNA